MEETPTCCELINTAQQQLSEIPFNIPSEGSDLYSLAANSGLCVSQNGLSKLSDKTCDPDCCKAASEAIVKITQDYFDLLDQINEITNNLTLRKQNYKIYLCLLTENVHHIIKSSKHPKSCCIASYRAIAIFEFQRLTFSVFFAKSQPLLNTYQTINKIIQSAFDRLDRLDQSLACLCQLASDLVTIQQFAINYFQGFEFGILARTFGQGNLQNPTGIAIRDNFVYVTDSELDDVRVFNKFNEMFIVGFGSAGNYQAITIDDNLAYVANDTANPVEVYDLSINPVVPPLDSTFGVGNISSPTGIAISGNRAYVTDSLLGIQVFNKNTGAFLGSFGSGSYQAIAIENNLAYVANNTTNLVEVWNLSEDPPQLIRTFGQGILQFSTGITIKNNLVYVTDLNSSKVQVFDKTTGGFLGSFGSGNYQAITIENNLAYVVDNITDRVEVFNLDNQSTTDTELRFFNSIVKQLVNKNQVPQSEDCCVSPVLTNIYQQYTDSSLSPENSVFRQFTCCFYRELFRLQENKIKQSNCCEESFLAIQQAYTIAISRFQNIINNVSNESQQRAELFRTGQVILKQVNQIISTLLSNKCIEKTC